MGRVHKKKIAEYAEAAENELNKSEESVEDEKKDSDVDNEEPDENDGLRDKENESGSDANGGGGDGGETGDDDFKSLQGDEDEEKNGARKANKRKAAQKSVKKTSTDDDNDISSDDEQPLLAGDGAGGAKKAKKSTAAAGKSHKKGGKGKAKKKSDAQVVEELGEEEYEVKEIVDHKVEKGVSLFLIRWKGYTKADDTWEPEDTLSCPDIIERYKKKQQSNGKTVKKGATPSKKAGSKDAVKEDPNKEWEVDKIIDYAMEKSGRVFRIRWKGFSAKYDTWEPEENLYCDDIIDRFMKRMKTQENVTFKELREEPKKTKRLVNETIPRVNYQNPSGRKSKRAVTKKRIYYGDIDE